MKTLSATAFAPATVANLAVGFDSLGLALSGFGDTVKATRTPHPMTATILRIDGEGAGQDSFGEIPLTPHLNTASVGVQRLLEAVQADFGVSLEIRKGIPLGSGLGGSSASAVAAVVATNALLDKPLSKLDLLAFCVEGEAVASGAKHADNVAPCLLGGLNLVSPRRGVIRLPFPENIEVIVAHPGFRLDTKVARAVLPKQVSLQSHVIASRRLAGFVSACYQKDIKLMQDSLHDDIVERARSGLIGGFDEVKFTALQGGAIGCSISGAGPAVFAFAEKNQADSIEQAMKAVFLRHFPSNPIRTWHCAINMTGAEIIL
jgi:homoserine kinase